MSFYGLLHFVNKEFEFVDIDIEISIQDMLIDVITVVGLTIFIIIIGQLLIRSTLL
jgi:hypothetical protein